MRPGRIDALVRRLAVAYLLDALDED